MIVVVVAAAVAVVCFLCGFFFLSGLGDVKKRLQCGFRIYTVYGRLFGFSVLSEKEE